LDNHNYQIEPQSLECILAAGKKNEIRANAGNALSLLQDFIDKKDSWLFGHLGYDLKNEIEDLSSSHPDRIGFPDLYFFEPEFIIHLNENELIIEGDDPCHIFRDIEKTTGHFIAAQNVPVSIQEKLNQDEYIGIVKRLQQHILRGELL